MAKRTAIDKLGWIPNIILTILLDPLVHGINRILKGRVIVGILWILTLGLFGIGLIIDIVTVILKKKITILT